MGIFDLETFAVSSSKANIYHVIEAWPSVSTFCGLPSTFGKWLNARPSGKRVCKKCSKAIRARRKVRD